MIKLRLWGKPEEVQSMENFIKSLEGFGFSTPRPRTGIAEKVFIADNIWRLS